MDRNSVIGLLLIGLILVVFTYVNKPDREALEKQQAQEQLAAIRADSLAATKPTTQPLAAVLADTMVTDSALAVENNARFGPMAPAATGRDSFYFLSNDRMRIRISAKGGFIDQVELPDYQTWEKDSLVLFKPDSTRFNISIPFGNRFVSTEDLYFTPEKAGALKVSGKDSAEFVMVARGASGAEISLTYRIKGDAYLMDVRMGSKGLEQYINAGSSGTFEWSMICPRQEKNLENERNNTTVYYKYAEDEVDHLNPVSDEKSKLDGKVEWLAFKQQFFTSVILSKNAFDNSAEIATRTLSDENHTKAFNAVFSAPLEADRSISFGLFFGPTHYKTLKATGFDLQKQIPLGWGIFGYVNKWIVIPVFNFFDGYQLNYGIVILLLTLVIKLLLFPLQFKSYLSQAKMKVLKPEVDELNAQYEKDDPLKKQQAVMALYKRAGVNPLGGCLPLLFQMPILFAMFNFFPAAIELRQQSFLWAEDLSTYDSILNLPFKIPFYGNHVSLFALLMTASTILYTRMNNQLSGANSQMMPGMKFMMYLMPVIFLFVLNSYAAGLNYYYFLANIITFGQQSAFRLMVDEKKIHEKIQQNKKKPQVNKTSGLQKRLEEMARKKGYQAPGKKK